MTSSQNPYARAQRDMKYAVLGAGGFVGAALVERLYRAEAQVTPLVRRIGTGGALLARFGLPQRIANVLDRESLTAAFAGADVVFHCVTGDRAAIVQGLENSLAAAQAAGVRRLIYLSSAVVYGFRPRAAVDESSPIDPPGWSEYAKNKAAAEKIIGQWRGGPETVVLRPSIIYCPRGKDWSETPARQIASGTAYLVDQGRGYMNEIHISHLVDAMLLVAHHPAAANKVYVLQDGFGRTWQDYYRALCQLLGVEFATLAAFSWQDVVRNSSKFRLYQKWVTDAPGVLRSAVWHDPLKAWLKQAPGFESLRRVTSPPPVSSASVANGSRMPSPAIAPDLGVALLHTYPKPIVDAKIREELGFVPRLSLTQTLEGLGRWYRFMGLVC
jgi:nucleoside-diphosphate-sugar epimerase